MSRPKKTRTPESATALEIQEATVGLSRETRSLAGVWLTSLTKLNTVEGTDGVVKGVVVHSEADHKLAAASTYALKDLEQSVKKEFDPTPAQRERTRRKKLTPIL